MGSKEELNKLDGSLSQWIKFKDKFVEEIKADPENEGLKGRLLKSKQKIQEINNKISTIQNSENHVSQESKNSLNLAKDLKNAESNIEKNKKKFATDSTMQGTLTTAASAAGPQAAAAAQGVNIADSATEDHKFTRGALKTMVPGLKKLWGGKDKAKSDIIKSKKKEQKILAKQKKEKLKNEKRNAKNAKKGNKKKGKFFSNIKNISKNNSGTPKINFLFILALIIHVIDGFLNFNNTSFRVIAYLFLFFFGWLVVFRPNGSSWRETGIAAGISGALALGAFFVPILMVRLLDPIMSWTLVNVLRICFPVYYLYFLFNPSTPLLKTIQTWVFWFWVWIFIIYLIVAVTYGTLDDVPFLNALDAEVFENQDDADAGGAWRSLWDFIWETLKNIFGLGFDAVTGNLNTTKSFGKSRLEYATGGHYSGNEENAPAQGVFIKNIEYSRPDYIEGDVIEIAARIDIQTPSDSLEFSVGCEAKNEMDKEIIIKGEILELPDGRTLIGYKDELLPITCSFKDGLSSGPYDVVFKVLYDYETSSSLKIYFIDKERKNAMRAEGIDPLVEYGKNTNPKAIYTNGPIKLGIKQPALPIGLDFDNELGPLIGFTIENDWGGEISEINSIYMYTPEGLSLDIGYCDEFSDIGKENGMNVYKIANPAKIQRIEDYLTINCKTIINSKSSLLGDDEVSTKEIKVITSYIFETKKSTDVRIG